MKIQRPITFLAGILVILIAGHSGAPGNPAMAAETTDDFFNAGPVSISKKYTLAKDISFIVFKIRNNTTRTINGLYGWVFKIKPGENNRSGQLSLINNPHRSGLIIKGKPHAPGKLAEWRFPLLDGLPVPEKNEKFTLQVNQGSVFYSVIEAQSYTEEEEKKK